METVPAKTILQKAKNAAWFGSEYNMNLYRGCTHGCIYCDSRSECYRNPDFDTVKAKENALFTLRGELNRKVKSGVVATGAMSDPYNPHEKTGLLTRHALELLSAYGFGVAIATKSPLVTRDTDVLSEIRAQSPVIVKITITTANDELANKIEPRAPSSSQRFDAVKKLRDAGIFCGILLMPVLPFINDGMDNSLEIVKRAENSGANFIYPWFGVTLRDRQREYFLKRLDESFPGTAAKYIKRFGTNYMCDCPNAKNMYAEFKRECLNRGILTSMKDIVAGYRSGYGSPQLSLF